MNVRLGMYGYCYSNLGAIYAKSLFIVKISTVWKDSSKVQIGPFPADQRLKNCRTRAQLLNIHPQ